MPTEMARWHNGMTMLDGTLYICGGRDQFRAFSSCLTLVNPMHDANAKWQMDMPDMLAPKTQFALLPIDGVLYALGGCDNAGDSCVSQQSVFAYDPNMGIWHEARALPDVFPWPRATYGAVVVPNSVMHL
jgi:hypothetical protein